LALITFALSEEHANADEKINLAVLQDLESETTDTRNAAMEHVLKNRDVPHDAIKAIVEKYRPEGFSAARARDALWLLGRLQAREQIPYLVSLLDYSPPHVFRLQEWTFAETLPAAAALIYIGLPSIKPVIERLRHEHDEKALVAGAGVLRYVLGRKVALERIEKERKSADLTTRQAFDKIDEFIKRPDRILSCDTPDCK
jgi:hypothetical protein